MQTLTIPDQVYQRFLAERSLANQSALPREEFEGELLTSYKEFERGNISLGVIAERLGINKPQLIDILDLLGWRATNI